MAITQNLSPQSGQVNTFTFQTGRVPAGSQFAVKSKPSEAYATYPGSTVTVDGGVTTVTLPVVDGFTPYKYKFGEYEGSLRWKPVPEDTRIGPEGLNFDVATQTELDTTATSVRAEAKVRPVNTVTAAYTLAETDAGKIVELNSATAAAVTVPANATVAIPVGAVVILRQYGAGNLTVAAAAGVTIRSAGGALRLTGQYAEATLTKRATDEWVLAGSIAV